MNLFEIYNSMLKKILAMTRNQKKKKLLIFFYPSFQRYQWAPINISIYFLGCDRVNPFCMGDRECSGQNWQFWPKKKKFLLLLLVVVSHQLQVFMIDIIYISTLPITFGFELVFLDDCLYFGSELANFKGWSKRGEEEQKKNFFGRKKINTSNGFSDFSPWFL